MPTNYILFSARLSLSNTQFLNLLRSNAGLLRSHISQKLCIISSICPSVKSMLSLRSVMIAYHVKRFMLAFRTHERMETLARELCKAMHHACIISNSENLHDGIICEHINRWCSSRYHSIHYSNADPYSNPLNPSI